MTAQLRELGVGAFAYTPNDEQDWVEAEAAGVNLIVTDDVASLRDWIHSS